MICALLLCTAPTAAASVHHELLSHAEPERAALPKVHPVGSQFAEKRARVVEIAPSLMHADTVRAGDTLALNLFDDAQYDAIVDRVVTHPNGALAVRARIEGTAFGFAILSSAGGRTIGTIEIPDEDIHYHIQSGPDGTTHFLLDLDMAAQAKQQGGCGCSSDPSGALLPPPEIRSQSGTLPDAAVKSGDPMDLAVIELMIVYTPAARAWADQLGGGMDAVIAHVVERGQLVLDNSGVNILMPLAHSAEVDYAESGCPIVDLQRVTAWEGMEPFSTDCNGEELPIVGFMHEVHEWRDDYGADIVAMLNFQPGTGGIAWLPDLETGRPGWAYSVSSILAVTVGFTLIHEIGHNLGASHHKDQNYQPGPGLFPYAAGWRWTGEDDTRYASVQTYEQGQYFDDGLRHSRAPVFSNPGIAVGGVPAGHPEDGDNARTLREMKHVAAAYRPPAYDYFAAFETSSAPATSIEGESFQRLSAGAASAPVKAVAPPSWTFREWRVDGGYFSDANPLVIENIAADMVLTAHFDAPSALKTPFGGESASYGNMFDIVVSEPVVVTGFDVNLTRNASINTLEFYVREGGSFGAESSSDGWELWHVDEAVVSRGTHFPTFVGVDDLLLLPGQTYGIYINLAASNTSTEMRYHSGDPLVHSTAEMSLTTNCAKGSGGFAGSTFFPRRWNGTVYYSVVTPPVAQAIEPMVPSPTNAEVVDFHVSFSDPVVNFANPSQVIVTHDGTTHDSIDITGSGTEYAVTVGGLSGDGSFTIAVDTESNIEDVLGQALAASVTSEPFFIDHTPPNAVSVAPENMGPTNASTIAFTAVFDEAVQPLDPAADIMVTHDGTAHEGVTVSGSGDTHTITIAGISGDGSFTVSVVTGGPLTDLAGNALASGAASSAVLIDNTPPEAPAILTDFGAGPGGSFTTSIQQFELSGAASEDTVALRVNGQEIAYTLVDGAWTLTVDVAALGPEFLVTALDGAGNESLAAAIAITYDPSHDADGNGLTDQEEMELAGLIPADPLDPLLPRSEWFVSAADGDDAPKAIDGGGTEDSPWRSIAFAMEQLAPLARGHFPLRVVLDDAANTTHAGEPVALYQEPSLALIPHITVETRGEGTVQIRPSGAGDGPVVRAAANAALHGVTVLPAAAPDGPVTLLQVGTGPFTARAIVLDGEDLAGSVGVHLAGPASSTSAILQSAFVRLGTGVLSVQSSATVADSRFDAITANGAGSRAVAIRLTAPPGQKQAGVTPMLGRREQALSTGFNRFRGLADGAKAIVFLDSPFDFTLAQYNDWGVYSEEAIRGLIGAPSAGGVTTVFISPFIPAHAAIEPGGLSGVVLDADTHQPIPTALGPGVETGEGAYQMADANGFFAWHPGELPGGLHGLTAKAMGYADADPVLVLVGPDEYPTARFLLAKSGAPRLAVSPAQVMLPGAGGSASAAISNTGTGVLHWAASTAADWLSLEMEDNTLTVTASRNATGGSRSGGVQVSSANAVNGPIQLTVNQEAGPSSHPADVNADGVVNAVDVQLVINAALGIAIDAAYQADINGDGLVNAVDVQLVTNAALGIEIAL